MEALYLVLAVVGTIAIFATTRAGRDLRKRLGFRDGVPGAAPKDDVQFLLDACGGDRGEVERRLAAERERLPALTEAEHYRRAIRKVMAERSPAESR